MPQEEPKIVNLGGVMEGFPHLVPEGFEGVAGQNNSAISVNDMFNSLGSGETKGRPSLPITSFYTGNRYNTAFPGTDIEEMYGQQQSSWNKWANGLGKMVGTAGTTFVSGTAGLVYGLGASVKDGKFSSLYDNDVTIAMDDFSKQMEDVLPNYYTHQEQDADWYSPDNLMTANFWADKVIKNLGFSAGALGGGFFWGAALRATGITNALVRAGRSLEMIEATEKVMTSVPKAQRFGALQTALNNLSQTYLKSPTASILKSSDRILTSAMGTFGEASLEALHNLNDYRTELINEYKDKYGVNPTGEDLTEINDFAQKVGNFTWGMNTLLLTGTNYVMLPKILGSSRKADKALGDILETGTKRGIKFGGTTQNYLTRLKGAGALLFSRNEAFEEGAQFAIQTGTKEYFDRAYKNKEDVNEFFTTLSNVLGTTLDKGVDATLNTKEGMENVIIGGFSGALQQARGTIKEQGLLGGGGQRKRNTDIALSALNKKDVYSVLQDGANYAARGINSQALRQEAIAENDVLSEKDYEMDYTMSYILPRVKYGKIDALNQEVDYYLQQSMSDKGFQELKNEGIIAPNETHEAFSTRIQNIKEIANSANVLYSQISDKYSNYVDSKGNPTFTPVVIERMVYAAAKVQNYDIRIPEVAEPLMLLGIDTDSIMEGVTYNNEPSVKPLKEAIKEIESLNSIQEDDLKQALRDSVELALRRKKFVDEYNELKRNPQAVNNEPVPSDTTKFEFVNNKEEKEPLIVNRQYSIPSREAKVKKVNNEERWELSYPNGSSKFYNTPEEANKEKDKVNSDLKDVETVKILALNPNGTVQVEDVNGDRYSLPLESLKGYERVQTEQEKLQKHKAELDKEQSEIEKESGTSPTNTVEEDINSMVPEDKKKATSHLFTSTTSASEDRETLKPHIIRTNTFLNNAKNFDNFSKLKTILVTQNQEVSLGLTGLTALSLEGSGVPINKYTDLNEGLVAAVYVEQDENNVYFVDKDGKRLNKVGEQIDLQQVVFSTMPTTYIVWNDGKTPRYRAGERDAATEQSKRWEAKRKQLFSTPEGKYEMYDFAISRGIPTIADNADRYSVEQSLVPEDKIATQENLIIIPTTGTITHRGEILKFPNGRPVLQYGDTLQFLSNNNFNKKQAKAIFEVMKALGDGITSQAKEGKKIKPSKKYSKFLQNVLYWRKSANTSNNQIFLDTTGMNFFFGGDMYDLSNIGANEEAIVSKLQTVFNSVNNVTLSTTFSAPFTEYYLDYENKLSTREWTNYQSYLLSSKYPDGSKRAISDIPLSTSVNPPTEAVPYNFKQKYAMLQGMELPVLSTPKVVVKEAVAPKVETPVVTGYVLDGKTQNTYTLKNGDVQFTATKSPEGTIEVNVESNPTITKIAETPASMEAVNAALKATGKFDATKENEELVTEYVALRIAADLQKQAVPIEKPKEQAPAKITVAPSLFTKLGGEKRFDEVEEELRKPKDFSKTIPPANSEYRRQGEDKTDRISPAEIELFKEWHSNNTPNIPYEILENVLITHDGEKAWGAFENNVAKFYKSGLKGTEYHEIFEGIWASMLTAEDQQGILDEFKSKPGSFTDRQSGKKIKFDEATDLQAKERIADDFADFRLGKLPARSLGEKIARFFKAIMEFFKQFVTKPTKKEELFKAIDTGEFKDVKPTIADRSPEYARVEGLTEQQTNEFVQDITARFFQKVFGNNTSLYNPELLTAPEIFNDIKGAYEQEGKLGLIGESAWNQLIKRTKDYLRTFKIEFDEDNVLTINNEGQDNRNYAPEPFSTNWKKSSPFPVKLLLGTLTETEAQNQENQQLNLPAQKLSSINGYKLLNFSRAFATVLDKLANTTKVGKMVDKLIDLAKYDSNYVRLFSRLKGDRNTLEIDFSKFQPEDWRLFVNFYQTFTKQKPDAFIQYVNNGEVYTSSANLSSPINVEKQTWIENLKGLSKKTDSVIKYNKESKTYTVEGVNELPIKTPQDQVKFLSKIGVEFSMEAYNKLKDAQKTRFSNAVSSIRSYFGSEKDIMSVTGKTLGINGQLTTLAEMLVKITNPNQEVSYFGLDGRRRQSFSDNNAVSILENDFNNAETLQELLEARPELTDIFSQNSQVLKLGGLFFDNTGKRIKSLKVSYIQGTNNIDGGRETITSALSLGDRFTQEINQNLNGNYYVLIPADSSTEWMINLDNQISFEDIENKDNSKIFSVFKGYLKDDIALAIENRTYLKNTAPRAKELRFFNDILSDKILDEIDFLIKTEASPEEVEDFINTYQSDINIAVTAYIQNDVNLTINSLKQNNQIYQVTENNFTYSDLDDNFAKKEELTKYNLSSQEINDVITYVNTNYIINNIELHKILFGDPFQFAIKNGQLDETKRIKSFLSPRRTTFDSPSYNTFLNQEYNKAGEVELSPEDPGYHQFKSFTNTVTLQDVTLKGSIASLKGVPEDIKKAYSKTNEADAFSIIMDNTYREVKLKNGQWSTEAENWHQYQMAYTRQNMPGYEYSNKSLEKQDLKTLGNPQPKHVIEILKPIVSGTKHNSKTIELNLDKMSQMPLYYSMVEGTNLEQLYIKMWKENKGYVVFESGRKVGAGELHNLYNEDGKFNETPFNNNVEVPWTIYGIQVENSYEGPKEQTRGSQITKLSSLDLFNNGVPVSEAAQKEYSRNRDILHKMHMNGYKNLLNSLGIEDLDGVFQIVDNVSISNTLQHELLRREASENMKDILQLDENGEFRIPFEASSAYVQIKDILYSMVDKAIVSPKMNGGAHVQVPVTLWESSKEGRKVVEVNGKQVLTDSTLKFYTKEDPYCEILLPAWFKDKINLKRFKTDAEILNYLNRTQEGKDILKGIGFRIPTQALSSIEVFRVKGFIPSYMGNTVVVPSEITTKAGSDFDIDKLNMYLKAIYTDEKGDIKLVKYKGSEEETKEFYGKVFDRKLEKQQIKKSELLEALQILHYGLEDSKGLINKYGDILNIIVIESKDGEDLSVKEDELTQKLEQLGDDELQAGLKTDFVNEMYKRSLENEYYYSLEKLLTLPEAFDRLITPVDDAGLKDMSNTLDNLMQQDESSLKNRILSRNYMTSTRHAFVTGKKWVGIAAVNITGHSLAQKSEIYIDPERFNLISSFDAKILGDGEIVLPHNTTKEGNTSISGTKTADGKEYISNRLSGYATSFVDVAKDPYILKIIKSDLAIGTFMFLERIGAGENTALFMNQPIINEYLGYLDSINARGLYNKKNLNYIREKFTASKKEIEDAKIDVSQLSSNIKNYSERNLTNSENAVQQKVLDEFLKYAKMAEYSFKLTQASNYDTTKFRSQDTLFKKQTRTEQARERNIFSSVDKLLDGSFIGDQSFILSYASEAIGEILKLDKYEFRENAINPILKPFAQNEYLNGDKYDVISTRIITSFIDFNVITKTGLNSEIKALLVDNNTAVANSLAVAKEQYPQLRILKDLEIVSTDRADATKSIKLKANIKDSYDENLYTEMMRELRDFGPTNQLYKDIVKLSILQGSYQSAISISNIIPVEDRSAIIAPVISTLNPDASLEAFSQGGFQRNNWKNPDVFRKMEPKFFATDEAPIGEDQYGNEIYQYISPSFPNIANLNIKASDRKILLLNEKYESFNISSDFILVPRMVKSRFGDTIDISNGRTVTKSAMVQRKLKGDYSLNDVYGYKKVKYSNGEPVLTFDKEGNSIYIYKLINLWGDGMYASEYYLDNRPSVLNNGSVKITQEIPDNDIINFYGNKIAKQATIGKPNTDGSSEIPKCS